VETLAAPLQRSEVSPFRHFNVIRFHSGGITCGGATSSATNKASL
jgi:hypothetical protein